MRDKTEAELIRKYPTIFQNVTKHPTESCMSWGLECNDGWYDLIDKLCADLLALNPTVVADQVKEKFGGLRFYAHFMADEVNRKNDEVWDLISKAEDESFKICEVCGAEGQLSTTGSWLKTLCPEHREDTHYHVYEGSWRKRL
jgi:hypothetical protein